MIELVVDSLASCGGAISGIRAELGRDPDTAINHNPIAPRRRDFGQPSFFHEAAE